MRTGIYVYRTTMITLSPSGADMALKRYPDKTTDIPIDGNSIALNPGIYKIESMGEIAVTGEGVAIIGSDANANVLVVPTTQAKDDWPIPTVLPIPNVSVQQLFDFVTAKSLRDI